ncbi:MAG: hypothetical protein ACRD0Z_16410 [Acidimicrobiales bacterium]
MSLQRQDVDKLLAPALVAGLPDVALDEVRARRDACKRVEDLVSYVRRVIQGQLDLVTAEMAMRAGGTRGDLETLVERLPDILAGPAANPNQARPVVSAQSVPVGEFEPPAPLSTLGGGSLLAANIGSFSDAELQELSRHLQVQEKELSEQRHALHERIDLLQASIVERYKSGAADIDSLLVDAEADGSEGP